MDLNPTFINVDKTKANVTRDIFAHNIVIKR